MKYYISLVSFILLILVGVSIFFPVKDSLQTSQSGWKSTLSRISQSPKNTASPTTQTKTEKTVPPTSTKVLSKNLTPTTNVLGAKSTPTSIPSPTAIPTPTAIPLFLTLTSPTGDTEVSVPTVTIIGKTVPNAEVFVNDQTIHANAVGIFSTTVNLEEGENLINISANNSTGAYNEKEIVITYNKP